jgi:hypothetical protein
LDVELVQQRQNSVEGLWKKGGKPPKIPGKPNDFNRIKGEKMGETGALSQNLQPVQAVDNKSYI